MNREQFKEEAKQNIDRIFTRIEELEAKKDEAGEHVKEEYEEMLDWLNQKKSDLETKYHELTNASDEKWEEVRSAFSSAADSFKEGFSKIGDLFT